MKNSITKNIIEKIVAEKMPCIFFSPHLDDAVLSAGGLIRYLSKKTKVIVVTVFTKASPKPYTHSTTRFLNLCGYADGEKLFEDRKKEDLKILSKIGVEVIHLNYVDAAWRKKSTSKQNAINRIFCRILPELVHVYPIHRLNINSGKISKLDVNLMRSLSLIIKKLASRYVKPAIFCPLGVNTHIDHVIVRNTVKTAFNGAKVYYWTDFPYQNYRKVDPRLLDEKLSEAFSWNKNLREKALMIKRYKSQVAMLFPKGEISLKPETYYVNNK